MQKVVSAPTLVDLRRYIRETVCQNDQLDPDVTPMREGEITRSGRTCGLFFQIQGPRLLKAYAVWSSEEHRIRFYGSNGIRIGETLLSDSPEVGQKLAA